jgi:hypothetical protein
MQGNTDYLPEDCTEQEFVDNHNDYALFSLRNMLVEIETNSAMCFETQLAQYMYEKIVDSGTKITLIGQVNCSRHSFHESLNTLEFCAKFMHCRCTHQLKDSILQANEFTRLDNILDTRNQSLPIKSPQMTPVCDSENPHDNSEAREQHYCREVQISYLDNN